MLSLKSGQPIAIIEGNKDKKIFFKDASKDSDPELDTSPEQKLKMFRKYLMRDDKLKKSEIDMLSDFYKNNEIELKDRKMNKFYEKATDYVNIALKRHLDFGDNINLFPIITQPSYRCLISGLSGSGKSHFASEFLKINKPKKGGGIFLFSPVENDSSIKQKNIIHIKLENYEMEYEKKFELEDLPAGSVCIFDDCDTYDKKYRNFYIDVRNALLERGRHLGNEIGVSVIVIQHQALAGMRNRSDIVLRECEFYCIFPKYNVRDSQLLLKNYTSISNEKVKEIMDIDNSRWVFIKKSVPSYYISQHDIGII